MIDIGAIQSIAFNEQETIRLISTAYLDEPAMLPLADNDDELGFLEDIEGLTSRRRGGELMLPAGVHRDELLTEHDGYGWSYVNAAFCYTRPTGNRFNGPDRGAWYATWGKAAVETAHAEVTWHLTSELEAVGVYENVTSYRELRASFATRLHDLSEYSEEIFLNAEPTIGYPSGQTLAANLRAGGSNGILFPSVRYNGGNCLAAFRPNIIQNIRQAETWQFTWQGSPEPKIDSLARSRRPRAPNN